MISNTEDFFNSYNKQWESYSLPHKLESSYQIVNCLKETEDKTILLLSDFQQHFYILKKGTQRQIALMQQEYDILSHLEALTGSYYPQCIDFWTENDTCYLLRTYIQGPSLADYLDRKNDLPIKEILKITLEICHIAHSLHNQQPPIIHRDIKPENFIINESNHKLSLIDFDTARQFSPGKSRDTRLMGTPSHAAPEQFGFYQSDFRTDIYGIGKTMLYLATKDTEETDRVANKLPKPLYRIIKHCISFSPEQRYSNVRALQQDLKHYYQRLAFRTSPAFHICVITIFLICAFVCAWGVTIRQNTARQEYTAIANSSFADNNDSLMSQAAPSKYNLYQYQETFDTILLSYFADDYETMIIETEHLIEDLYANEALCEIEADDYSLSEYLPEHFWYQEPPHLIRTFLVYRNSIMKENLGNYTEARPFIVGSLNAYFYYPGLFEGTPNIVLYSNCPKEEQSAYYEQALIDYLSAINGAFDSLYGYKSPTEKGYSDE